MTEPPETGPGKRIALLALHLESNRFAPPVGRKDFAEKVLLSGDDIMTDAAKEHSRMGGTMTGFIDAMNRSGPWTSVPIVVADIGAAGPIAHDFYMELYDEMKRGLEAAMPLDGVYFGQHGAAVTTEIPDPDGAMFAMARAIVGPDIPVISTLDLHGNVSDEMVAATDMLIAYRTNPHVDQYERGAEAAGAMRELLTGLRPQTAFIRLPLVAPQVCQRTAVGPYGAAIDRGQTFIDDEIMNVSILGGFTYGDTPYNGMAFLVTTRGNLQRARAICRKLAEGVWAQHDYFVPHLTPLEDCVARAVACGADPALPSVIIADVADNPGGGGRGNTTWLLEALVAAGAKGAILGVMNDPPLAAEAHALGVGKNFEALFNRNEADAHSNEYRQQATVLNLSDGKFIGADPGTFANLQLDLGPTAVLQVGSVTVVVASIREQCIDPNFFESFGVNVAEARSVTVKSRGHFRAGFLPYFPPERVIECDAPGLSSPTLSNFDWTGFPRPVFPLDPDTQWTPPDW